MKYIYIVRFIYTCIIYAKNQSAFNINIYFILFNSI